jgi:putative ABC transport system permease protein
MLGEPPVNEFNKTMGGVIIGVCKDYNFQQLTQKIGPAYHVCSPNLISYFYVRIKPGQSLPAVMDRIRTNWNRITANELFSYSFLDETVNKVYEPYQKWMRTITIFCWMAVLLACLGLFGLSGLNTINRTKEIGIRKVLGAGVSNIFLLLNKQILGLAGLSMLIGVPLATYLSNEWLQNFAYRIHMDWSIYLIAGFVGIVSAVLAVSYHTLKAANANPVESLRTE